LLLDVYAQGVSYLETRFVPSLMLAKGSIYLLLEVID
jgi:hypothetical protein